MIGDKIKALRKSHKLTQVELAEKLGTTQSVLQRWESGKKNPGLRTLKSISKIFDISLDTLAFNDKDLETLKNKDRSFISKLNNFEKLSEQDRQTVANLIDSLASKN